MTTQQAQLEKQNAPDPHERSLRELLDLMTDKVIDLRELHMHARGMIMNIDNSQQEIAMPDMALPEKTCMLDQAKNLDERIDRLIYIARENIKALNRIV